MATHAEALQEGARAVAGRLRKAGFEAWFAGGCVRDLLLGGEPKDWDIATDATPTQVQEVFPKTLAIGAAFGVIQVLHRKGLAYEVATFRADGEYGDGRRPDEVHYSQSREEDVQRRDFTINALLMDPETDEILDYVGGRADLEARLIRAVGDPRRRFREDRLRMLRALRFAARLDFRIEPQTRAAVEAEGARLDVVSPERVTQELEGIFRCSRPDLGARLLRETGLYKTALEAAAHPEFEAALARSVDAAPSLDVRLEVAWALAYREHPDVEAALRAHRLAKARIRGVQDLLLSAAVVENEAAPRAQLLRLARHARGPDRLAYLEAWRGPKHSSPQRLRAAADWLRAHPPSMEAMLDGADLKGLGWRPGRHFKAALDAVEDEILEGRIQTKPEALAFVAGLSPESSA